MAFLYGLASLPPLYGDVQGILELYFLSFTGCSCQGAEKSASILIQATGMADDSLVSCIHFFLIQGGQVD